ncbi:hypothetical protein FB567DRAFT_559899 [Paraphoma chrysanthemicola]|uniref:DUF7708 domain-containing protein n=1 Tax=Paraphoma chrysanthemicola TaxID=798071 RepID=A0A8K0VZC2_9PLEO|nr:hypothetical protein FB567DRAFT_559899 [Paraphoma chrysanthemicola]
MAVNGVVVRDVVEQVEGRALVRRFTGELAGNTTLERAAISAQEEDDEIANAQMEARMRDLFQDENGDDAIFHAAEIARLALKETCDRLEMTENAPKLSKLSFRQKTARAAANDAVGDKIGYGFAQLSVFVKATEGEWKSKQGEPARRFRSLCGSLDAHKNVFAIFPSQNEYASVLCGSLKLIIGAAVNHDEIAEVISETVTEITEKAARAAKMLLLVRTREMRQLFSQLYAQVFAFYRSAMEWYLKSKPSRFFASFNEKIKDQYEKAATKIEKIVTEMYRQNDLAQFAWLRIQHTDQERREEIRRQRLQTPDQYTLRLAGRNVQELLQNMHKRQCIEASAVRQGSEPHASSILPYTADNRLAPDVMDRKATRDYSKSLERFIIGTEGHSFMTDGKFWIPDVDISAKLHGWLGNDDASPTLWVSSPEVIQVGMSSSRAAALSLLVAAWQAELPIISHFCERPRFATLPADRDVERVGLIGLVFSLITQLLQFAVANDSFQVSHDQMEDLDGSDASWSHALELLVQLLRTTPQLGLCVIDGLNDLSFTGGAQWCSVLLTVLFEHQRSAPSTFRILLTTSGQSRVLQDHVEVSDRAFAMIGGREVIRGGQWVSGRNN